MNHTTPDMKGVRTPCQDTDDPASDESFQVFSATPLTPEQFAIDTACPECCLPLDGFSHKNCEV